MHYIYVIQYQRICFRQITFFLMTQCCYHNGFDAMFFNLYRFYNIPYRSTVTCVFFSAFFPFTISLELFPFTISTDVWNGLNGNLIYRSKSNRFWVYLDVWNAKYLPLFLWLLRLLASARHNKIILQQNVTLKL